MKRLKMLAGTLLAAAGCLLTVPEVYAEELYDIQYEYVEESLLTEEEKALIRTGDVDERVQSDAQIKLIYRKKKDCEASQDLENPSPESPQAPEQGDQTTATSKKQSRPKTGDTASLPGLLALCGGSGAVIFLTMRKKKLAAGGLALVAVLSSLWGSVLFAEEEILANLPTEGKMTQSGSQVTYRPETVQCHDYVGYIIGRKKQGRIIARYFLGQPGNSVEMRREVLRKGEAGDPIGRGELLEEATDNLRNIGFNEVGVPLSPEEKADFISSYKKVAEEAVRLADEVRPNRDIYDEHDNYDERYRHLTEEAQKVEQDMNRKEYYKVGASFPRDSVPGDLGRVDLQQFFGREWMLDSYGQVVYPLNMQLDAAGNSITLREYLGSRKEDPHYLWYLESWSETGTRLDLTVVHEVRHSREVRETLEDGVTYIDFYVGAFLPTVMTE